MAKWSFDTVTGTGGRLRIWVTRPDLAGRQSNVTVFRGVQTVISNYSSGDPFGDSTAVLQFPQITAMDDLSAPDLAHWLAPYANVDIWWVPVEPMDLVHYPESLTQVNPLTQQPNVIAPAVDLTTTRAMRAVKVWEGLIMSMDFTTGNGGTQLELQCQGALFQLDHYLQKPFYPGQPWPLEKLIEDVFSHRRKPQLRTQPLKVAWPSGWTKRVPHYNKLSTDAYTPVAKPGEKWTGYTSRNTGGWEHALTGFVQDQLVVMLTDDQSGVTPGNQWTVNHQRAVAGNPGRQPILQVRDRFRAPDFAVWVGTPGVDVSLHADYTQCENVIYGSGTDINGEVWRNASINFDGSRTDYAPLAASPEVYPITRKGAAYERSRFLSEAYVPFGTGFSQEMATTVAKQQLARDEQPGWSGTITLATDVISLADGSTLPRWLIHAGMTVRLLGFAGTGEAGMPFHIASVEASPGEGTVQLTVDTRYRDLLTVAEAQARTRDPLTPTRMLQVNKTSVLLEDIQAPWDYNAGSGFIPKESTQFYRRKPASTVYPYDSWTKANPPLTHSHMYVRVNAAAPHSKDRWTRVAVLMSEKGTISRSEFFACDVHGNRLKVPFHVSFYYTKVTYQAMPRNGSDYSPFIDGAFESVNPATGQAWPSGNFLAPDDKFIVGWGNKANGVYNRAGFSPGSEAEGGSPTGLLFDDATWGFDCTNNPNYDHLAKPGRRHQQATALTIYAMFYCEHTEPVYFGGRLFRQNPGVS